MTKTQLAAVFGALGRWRACLYGHERDRTIWAWMVIAWIPGRIGWLVHGLSRAGRIGCAVSGIYLIINRNKTQRSSDYVYNSWDVLYVSPLLKPPAAVCPPASVLKITAENTDMIY